MPFDGSGTYNRNFPPGGWQGDADARIKIKADRHDQHDADLAAALSMMICKDGQSSPTANINWNARKIVNLANPESPQDAATKNYVDGVRNFPSAINISGSDPESHIWFTGPTGPWGLSFSAPDLFVGVRASQWVWNNKADHTGTDVMTLTTGGNLTVASNITAVGSVFQGSTSAVILASQGASGHVYLRPNGPGSGAGEFTVAPSGHTYAKEYSYATAFVVNSPSGGLFLDKWVVGGDGVYVQYALQCTNAGALIMIEAVHYVGVTTAVQFDVNGVVFGFNQQAQAIKPGGGSWTATSDARIKTVKGDYEAGLAEVLALRPVRYSYKGNDTPGVPSNTRDGPNVAEDKSTPVLPYANSGHYSAAVDAQEFIGLVAQEVEPVMPEMVGRQKGYIDGVEVDDLRILDTNALLYAVVNAIRELNDKVEALAA